MNNNLGTDYRNEKYPTLILIPLVGTRKWLADATASSLVAVMDTEPVPSWLGQGIWLELVNAMVTQKLSLIFVT